MARCGSGYLNRRIADRGNDGGASDLFDHEVEQPRRLVWLTPGLGAVDRIERLQHLVPGLGLVLSSALEETKLAEPVWDESTGDEEHPTNIDTIYDSSPVYDEYRDEEWYYWATGISTVKDPVLLVATGEEGDKYKYEEFLYGDRVMIQNLSDLSSVYINCGGKGLLVGDKTYDGDLDTDIVVEVRMSVLEHVKRCMLSNPYRLEAPQLTAVLWDRLLDYDESIRQKVVAVVSDLACHELSSISLNTIKLLADRLRDKSLPVKKYTMERLSDVYRTCCSDSARDDYDWIPGRVLRCFYNKDFRSDSVENVLCTTLFPADFSVRDKVTRWIRIFSKFDSVKVKALEKILEQKQRLQLELQKYLSLRHMYKESDASEIQKKVTLCFRFMSHCFTDPTKAKADFLLLHQLKDANVWKILTKLLDPNTTSLQACRSRDELLNIVGQKQTLHGLLSTLSMKCSYVLFNKDGVKSILLEAKSSRDSLLTQSCMNILVIIASSGPLLLSGTEKDLVHLLDDDNEVIKEGVMHVLAKAGGTIPEHLGESSSTLDLLLERIFLEGSRRQAKYDVHAFGSRWGFSNTGHFLDDNQSDSYIRTSAFGVTVNSELYVRARSSALSLTYYSDSMLKGSYNVSLHFAEIVFIDDNTYSSLGRSLGRCVFDIYIQVVGVELYNKWLDIHLFKLAHQEHQNETEIIKLLAEVSNELFMEFSDKDMMIIMKGNHVNVPFDPGGSFLRLIKTRGRVFFEEGENDAVGHNDPGPSHVWGPNPEESPLDGLG